MTSLTLPGRRTRAVLTLALISALVLAAPAGHAAGAPGARQLPLAWATSEFLAVEGGRLRLQHRYAFGEQPAVWMEAESPSSMALAAGKRAVEREDASGGRCVAYVDRLDFVVDVTAAGSYQSWTRCFFPFAASWNHTEGFTGGEMRVVRDVQPGETEKAGKWIWLKGPAYDLKPGACTYVFDGYHGGALLDKILLTRDPAFLPEGVGESSPNIAAHRTGRAETRDLRLGPVVSWTKLDGLPATGVAASVSLDAGKSWTPVPPDGSLAAVPARNDPAQRLRVRLEVTRTDTDDPIVEGVQLAYVPAKQELWEVRNRHLRLGFDPASGSLGALERLAEGGAVPCTIAGEQQPLFNILVQKPEKLDALAPLSSLDADLVGHTLSPDGRKLTMEFALLDGSLLARCTITADDTPLTRWNLRLTNRSRAKVFGAQFPLLSNVRIGDSPADDAMVLPWWGAGSRTENPASAAWSSYRNLLNYPGAATMQWLDLHDLAAGLYVAAYDPTCHDLELGYTQNRGQSVNVTFRKSLLLPPGKEWSCDYAVGLHPGDWHWAADHYREWARTWMKRPVVPPWVADTDGWIMPDGANFFGYPTLPACYRMKNGLLGMNWMQCWMQMTESEHCCGQFHYPSPLWGTPEDFRWACQEVHDLGGRLGFYINAQLYKPWHNSKAASIGAIPTEFIPKEVLAPYDPQWAFRWQARDFAGRPYDTPSQSPFDDGVRMNPASSGWQSHLIHWASDWYVGALGTDCIYFDQLSAAPSLPVYDDAKSDYGLWGAGYRRMVAKLLAKVRPAHPNFVLSMEGSNDLHGQQVATALYGTGPDFFDVYHYTFPEHILVDFGGYVNQFNKEFPGLKAVTLNTFLMGTRFCEYPPDDFGRGLFALRRRTQSLLFRSTYHDTVGVQTSDPAVRAKRFVRTDADCRAVFANLGNLSKKAGVAVVVDVSALKGVRAAWLLGMDGSTRRLACTLEKGSAVFEAPAIEAATAVFVERTGPQMQSVTLPASATAGSRVTGTVGVLNLSAQPMRGEISLLAPKGWKTTPVAFPRLMPGESKVLPVSLEVPRAAARAIHDLTAVVRGTGGEDRRYAGLAVVPPVEITEAAVLDDGIAARVRNRSPRPIRAVCSLDVFPGVKAPSAQTKALSPGAGALVKFPVAWPDLSGSRLPRTVRVAAEAEGLKTVRSLVVGPPVINGSFDMAVINGDKPEGWPIFGNRSDGVHLVSDHPYDGKACVRIDPAPTSPNVDQIIHLQPDTTYRLSAALRRPEAAGNPLVWISVREGPGKSPSYRLQFPKEDTTVNEWRVFSTEFRTPPQMMYVFLYACNGANTCPIWIDGVKVERVK